MISCPRNVTNMTWKEIICWKKSSVGPEMGDEYVTKVSGGGKSILMMLRVFCMSAFFSILQPAATWYYRMFTLQFQSGKE